METLQNTIFIQKMASFAGEKGLKKMEYKNATFSIHLTGNISTESLASPKEHV